MMRLLYILILLMTLTSCHSAQESVVKEPKKLKLGDERTDIYFGLLKGKRVGLVANQSSYIGKTHVLDTLISSGIEVVKIFSPEHGFRGEADAGEKLKDGIDPKTQLPIISLYGNNKKPSSEQLEGIEILLFDIQDVGVRFYTYISTLHYLMEAASENSISIIVLDRPNPHAHYVDGPIIKEEFLSFVGMHKVPVVYGMTIGEYAMMINGEKWLKNQNRCQLEVITCSDYNRNELFQLPIKPSPNLPNALSVQLYPSLCFFEGTEFSAGRGTQIPFQFYGHQNFEIKDFELTPTSLPGAKFPKFKDQKISGVNLSVLDLDSVHASKGINWNYLFDAYANFDHNSGTFFLQNNFFEKLIGSRSLRKALEENASIEDWKRGWAEDIKNFKAIRSKYLLY